MSNIVEISPKTPETLLNSIYECCIDHDSYLTEIEIVGALTMAQAYYITASIELTDE
tara:strand:+ start:3389 stop:3559 length:171 start_codon:yes stop_codon:yes gene_type:complete